MVNLRVPGNTGYSIKPVFSFFWCKCQLSFSSDTKRYYKVSLSVIHWIHVLNAYVRNSKVIAEMGLTKCHFLKVWFDDWLYFTFTIDVVSAWEWYKNTMICDVSVLAIEIYRKLYFFRPISILTNIYTLYAWKGLYNQQWWSKCIQSNAHRLTNHIK